MTLRRIATALIALLFAVALPTTSAYASRGGGGGGSHGGGHSGGGHPGVGSHNGHRWHGGHGHGHFGVGVVAGVGFGSLWWPWTYPIGPAVYDAPMWLPSSDIDPVYAPQVPAPAEHWWYYCGDTQTYYPYVQQCASPWQRVAPTPQQ